ncbi:MAG TPA: hypothetical protein VHD15_15565 [Hyphomicrobiales bacterium]|nr:hypothetical protein [Hyphomicrobiales bacterium]
MELSEEEISPPAEQRYVAFCDILGFSNRIISDFSGTVRLYNEFAKFIAGADYIKADVTIYSDSIIVSSLSLVDVIQAVNALWFIAQTHFVIIRGGIAYGRYWQISQDKHMFVVSDALVHAVKIEKSVGFPMVMIADNIDIPLNLWVSRFEHGPIATPLLHFRDRNIVNPFGIYWFASARGRILTLMEQSPGHEEKYQWLLALHEAIANQHDLVPWGVVERLIKMGVISRRTEFPSEDGEASNPS